MQNVYEDEAIADLERAISSGNVGGAPAPKKDGKKTPKHPKSTPQPTNPVSGAVFTPGGGNQGGPKAQPKDATQIALAKKHEDRTLQDKKLIACKFEVMGTCKAGSSCEYSHAKKHIDPARAKWQKAQAKNGKPPAAPAPVPPAPNAAAVTKTKHKAKSPAPNKTKTKHKPKSPKPKKTAASVAQALGIGAEPDGTQQEL